eukprot:scaffold24393_cov112-Isochrysis_galbana.AAC.10
MRCLDRLLAHVEPSRHQPPHHSDLSAHGVGKLLRIRKDANAVAVDTIGVMHRLQRDEIAKQSAVLLVVGQLDLCRLAGAKAVD